MHVFLNAASMRYFRRSASCSNHTRRAFYQNEIAYGVSACFLLEKVSNTDHNRNTSLRNDYEKVDFLFDDDYSYVSGNQRIQENH